MRGLIAAGSMVALLCGPSAAGAEQELFWDDFEAGDLCAWSNPTLTPIAEQEAVDGHTNDFAEEAEVISRCAVLDGTIGDPLDEFTSDTDYFKILVDQPTLLRVRIERFGGSSDFEPLGWILDATGFTTFGEMTRGSPSSDPVVTTRQIYLPEPGFAFLDPDGKVVPGDGFWYLNVDDARNWLGGPVGGVAVTYRVTLTVEPLTGPGAIPLSDEPLAVGDDGSAFIRRVDGTQVSQIDLIETVAGLDLDPKLYLVKKVGLSLVTVAGSDDIDFDAFNYDSSIGPISLTAAPHFVVVDHYSKYDTGDVPYELTLRFLPPPP